MCLKWFKKKQTPPKPPEPKPPEDGHSEVVVSTESKVAVPGPPWIGLSYYQMKTAPYAAMCAFLDALVAAGGNVTEYFDLFSWAGGWEYQPWNFRPGETWPDYPIEWDLESPNFVNRGLTQTFLAECAKRGIMPIVRMHDFCSMKRSEDLKKLAFRANIQRLYQDKIHGGLWGQEIQAWYRNVYNKPLFEMADSVYANIDYDREIPFPMYVPMNEADYLKGENDTDTNAIAAVGQFHSFYAEEIGRDAGGRMIISTSRAFDVMAKWGFQMELHGCNSDNTMRKMVATMRRDFPTTGWWPNGDGPDPYALGAMGDSPSKRLPSVNQAFEMGKIIDNEGLWGWAGFARETEQVDPSDVSRAKLDVVKAMREGFEA